MGAGPPGGSRARVPLLALALANADVPIQVAAAEEQTTFSPEIAAIAATWPTWSHLAKQSQTAAPAAAAAARPTRLPASAAAVSSTTLPAEATTVSQAALPVVAAAAQAEQRSQPSRAPREASGDAQAAKQLPLGALPQRIDGFQLVGSRGTSLRGINGGRRCVDPWGFEPPGWQINATSLDLDTCALMASLQPNVVGFRWGRIGFNESAYMHYAWPRTSNLAAVDSAPVDLDKLFSGGGKFKCNIYVVSKNGKAPPPLTLDNSTAALGKHARRLRSEQVDGPPRKLVKRFRFFRNIEAGRTTRVGAYGRGVCMQRRSLLRYYDLKTTEMWFCFSREEVKGLHCAKEIRANYFTGAFSLIGTMVFVAILGYIAQSQFQLSWALSWVASFFVNLELAVASIALLLRTRVDLLVSKAMFEALALALIVVGTQFVFLPYVCCNATDTCPAMRMSYLLGLVILPCISLDLMSYWSAFPLLVNHWPVMLGLLGFVIDALRRCACGQASETGAPCAWPHSLLYTKYSPRKNQYRSMKIVEEDGLLKL